MEEHFGSGAVVKKKNSSGCLIIKDKGGDKEKKRPRLILSDSEASHELLEPLKRKIKEFSSSSTTARKKGSPESRKNVRNDESGGERKRSRLDLYDFDEYDEFDDKHMRNNYMAGRSSHQKEYGSGSSKKHIVYKRRRSQANNATNFPCARSKGIDYCAKSDTETKGDEAHLPISSFIGKLQKVSDEPIRFQGKNGVLKVMVNKKKKMGISDNHKAQEIKGSKSEDLANKKILSQPSYSSDSKRLEKSVQFSRTEERKVKPRKKFLTKSSKGETTGTGESDASLKQGKGSTSDQTCSSMKHWENEGKRTPKPTKSVIRIRGTEGKERRGSGTEKQLVREQIRNMLINAGWTIDYRPRRNRDYLDAVYINPSGTGYWSIIKAYEALQKQLEEEDTDSKHGKDLSHFSPLSEELLNKLTRQTQKKMEREMKKKRRDDSRSKTTKKSLVREFADDTDSDQDEEKLSFCKKHNGKSLRGQLNEAEHVREDNSGDKVYHRKPKRDRITTNSHMAQGRKRKKVDRYTLVVRTCDKGQNSETDCEVPSTGKRTILAWLIDCGVVQSSEKVQYMNGRRTQVLLEGWITRDGIHCGCCSKILTISKFELHGASKQRQPFQNIILESGISLFQCQIDAWKRQKGSEHLGFHSIDVNGDDPNDDTCGMCGDGGDLICCDGCPCTFHQSCLGIQMLPKGDWHCQNCTCKFCGMIADSIVEGNSTTIGLLKACTLCEKKYHVSCCEEDYIASHSRNVSTPFCGKKCQELFDHLQKLLGIKRELGAGYSWSLIHRTDLDSDTVHHRFLQNVECNSKLAVALSIMNECFLPVIDRRSKINLLRSVLYNCGSNFSRLNYSGFYTAILERSEEIISAASIRIHGTQLAEMPFIGTRHAYRRQGMCRRLLCAIESALCSLKVEKLIIPAIAEHMHTWTVVFGFHPLEESHRQEMKSMNMLVFPGTDMLQKQLVKQEKSDGNISAKTVMDVDLKDSCFPLPDLANKAASDSSFGHDVLDHNEKVAPMGSGSEVSNVSSKEDILICNSSEVSLESGPQIFSKDTKSESVCEPVECSTKLNYPSISCPTSLVLETENASLHTHVKGDIQSTAEVIVSVADEVNIQISCGHSVHDSLGEASIMDTNEVPNESQSKPAFGSTTGEGDESTIRPPSVASVDEIVPVKDDIHFTAEVLVSDADELNTEIAGGHSVHDSFGKTSIWDTTEVQDESQKKPIFGSIVHDTHENSVQAASGASGDAKVAPIETDFKSSVEVSKGDNHGMNAKGGVEPISSTILFISAESTAGKVAQTVNSVSVSVDNGAENHMVQINSDANQPTFCTKSELNASSEHISDAKVASNVLSS